MALTSAQTTQIRHYLGYPDNWRDMNTTLESQFTTISADAEALITSALTASPPGILASLNDIDAHLQDALTRLKARKVEDIELPGHDEILFLQSEGRRFVTRLATLFGVNVFRDVYSDDPPGGGLMGGLIPLG